MTEKRMRELAAEARERHRNDPKKQDQMSGHDQFWAQWGGWMLRRSQMRSGESLSYRGANDPTANAAVAHMYAEEKASYTYAKHDTKKESAGQEAIPDA